MLSLQLSDLGQAQKASVSASTQLVLHTVTNPSFGSTPLISTSALLRAWHMIMFCKPCWTYKRCQESHPDFCAASFKWFHFTGVGQLLHLRYFDTDATFYAMLRQKYWIGWNCAKLCQRPCEPGTIFLLTLLQLAAGSCRIKWISKILKLLNSACSSIWYPHRSLIIQDTRPVWIIWN